jgi:MYXO-CTERM domain-containing protein
VVLLNYAPTTNTGDEASLVIVTNGNPAVLEVDLKGNIGGEPIDTDTGSGGDSGGDSGGGDSGGGDTGTDPGDGQVLFTLEKGCEIPVDVTFSPVSVGDVYGSIIIETKTQVREDPDEDPEYWADLDNSRVVVYTRGQAEKGEGRAIVTPRSVPFGSVWTGEEEVRYIRVLNSGDGDLTLTAPTLDATCDSAFSLTYSFAEAADSTKVLESGKSSLIEVTFVPEDQKSAYCTVYVNSDDGSNPSVPVYLQGNNGTDPDNVAPTVSIRSPEAGYMHNNPGPIEMELNVFDKNQPATSLSCKVYSSLNVLANVADCTPTEDSGHVFLSVPTDDFNPGVDTLLVRVTDASGIRTTASLSMIINASYPSSDDDGDAFGTDSSELVVDCDDNNRATYPNAAEIYDSLDNDCDSIVDEGTIGSDDDGDTFSENDLDCDDTDEDTYPGAPESPDYKDNDCDGTIDENTTLSDDDGDGYAEVNNDCNDLDDEISPSAVEICDSVDNDCNGLVDDACLALDSEPLVIGGIDMSQTAVEEGDTVQLSTFIYDADGETIFFTWTTDGGTSAGTTSSTLSWTAPAKLESDEGELFQIYLVAQDASGHQVWDFARVAVYPEGDLFKTFPLVIPAEEEAGCSSSGAGAGVGLGLLGLGLAMARRRRQS